ncbi:hypothetical protein DdX_19321 [Ditylenchus destructor]|uniref:MULE transposase domain-containing protein n=1 Tax=Ditylenchus destructor TaxID=166010 RepID=A0AAD4MKN0_9BILA|nr:hypothetical protein DdX_19321 [Ditylenchus destructor]
MLFGAPSLNPSEPSQIVFTVASNQPDYVKAHLPNKKSLKDIIKRQRKEVVRPPAVPDSADLYLIPDCYRTYSPHPGTVEQFLLCDSGDIIPDKQRILILGRSSTRQWIHLVKKIYIDGTFKIAPFHFNQVFAVMGERGGFVLPIMFDMILSAFPLLEPESISLDYEIGLINSVKKKFDNVKLGGCLFHLSKNLKEHLKKNRDEQKNCTLYKRYCDEPDFAMSARMIVSMAFLRKVDIEDALESLYEFLPEELRPILDWFEEYYIGHQLRNGRRPALFAYEMWSVYQRTLDGEGRTNNHAEAAHRRLQTELAHDHPTLYALIEGLKKAQAARDVEYEEFVRGDAPPQKRQKFQLADARVLAILEDYENRTHIEILKGISQSYGMI